MSAIERAKEAQITAYYNYIHAESHMQHIHRKTLNDANEEIRHINELLDKGIKVP